MKEKKERPATGANRCGSPKSVQLTGEQRKPTRKQTFRTAPSGEVTTVRGRKAQALRLFVKVGERGITQDEARRFHWARRLSQYVLELRRLGVDVATIGERTRDARVGRYVLQSPVVLLGRGEGSRCG